ncbi:unnamed protein product [Lampetra fluviatilis]
MPRHGLVAVSVYKAVALVAALERVDRTYRTRRPALGANTGGVQGGGGTSHRWEPRRGPATGREPAPDKSPILPAHAIPCPCVRREREGADVDRRVRRTAAQGGVLASDAESVALARGPCERVAN